MKQTMLTLMLMLLMVPLGAQEVVELNLPNSSKLVVKYMFRNGSISDPGGKEGLTYATANVMMQGGTGELTYSQIQDMIYPMAAQYGVSVDKEVCVFTFEVHTDFVEEFYKIMHGLMLEPAFAEADFKRVMVNQQNYVDQVIRASSDEEYSKKALEDLLFRGTNYQHMKQGKSATVAAITLEDVRNHYKGFFTRNNVTLGIAGNYTPEFLARLKADVRRLPVATPVIPPPGRPNQPNGVEIEIIAKEDAFGSAIFTGTPLGITRESEDFFALMVANSWLGEHRKSYSRLYQKIRQTRSMNYGDYTYIEWYEQGGSNMLPPSGVPRSSNYFAIWIRPVQIAKQLRQQYEELGDVTIGHAHFALRMAARETALLVENGMSVEDFEATRTFLRSYIKLYAQTPEQRLGWLMDSRFYGREDFLAVADEKLAGLDAEDVNKALKQYINPDDMFVTIITDVSEAEPLAESLRENRVSEMSYSDVVRAGLPEEIREEDAVVAEYPLNVTRVSVVPSAETFK